MDFEIELEKEIKHRDYMELYKDPKQGPQTENHLSKEFYIKKK